MPSITQRTRDVAESIRVVFLEEMEHLVEYGDSPYIKFIPLIQSIEFLGACLDKKPFYSDEKGLSKKRFKKGMGLMGEKYSIFLPDNSEINFYRDFRCPMIHQFKHNQKKITLATRNNVGHQDVHLRKNENGLLYIVFEDFYNDIRNAAQSIIDRINGGELTVEKLKQPYLTLNAIEELNFFST